MNPTHKILLNHITTIPILLQTLQKKNTIIQLSILKITNIKNQYLYITNTHLYFKPNYPHIRLLQKSIILNHTKKIISQFYSKTFKTNINSLKNIKNNINNISYHKINNTINYQPLITFLLYDNFNNNPKSNLIKLLTSNHINTTHRN